MDNSISSFPPLPSHPTPLPQPPCADPSPSADATPSEPLISLVAAPSSPRNYTEVNGVTQVPMDLIMQGCNEWSDYVVGFFIKQRLSFPYVKNVLQQRWKDKGTFEIIADKDLFYFKFSSNDARQAVLKEGPIFSGRCFIINPWTRGVEKQGAMVTTIPMWVKCHNVPKELWTDDDLGFVASKFTGRKANERMTPNANASYENVVRNIVTYAGNGSGEDVNRRIWRVRSRPSALSEGARTSCIRNDRGEEIREQPTGTTAQHEPNGQSIDAQGNGTEVEELNAGVHETGIDPSIGLQLALYVPAEITTPIVNMIVE
ncbi:hypothetical protein IFM89_029171 [Coptis chinensis]|uniref:DUF4283 domain-containing protein n=1 Tax=Coptis chinensis TaxID=261450 RepID=A0A835IQL1_9MAGN|nr:hypothetical protein IFM89_029171 [Coptis chinensis]